MSRVFATVILASIMLAATLLQAEEKKSAVPDEAARKGALNLVAEVFKADVDRAKTPADKKALAQRLLAEGNATNDDLAAKYVLLEMVRDLAAQSGDLSTALTSVELLEKQFNVDAQQLQVDSALAVGKALPVEERAACARSLLPVIDAAIVADRYEQATKLAGVASQFAIEGKNESLVNELEAKGAEVKQIAAEYETAKSSKIRLGQQPDDPEANLVLGKFLCFSKGDWQRGLALLAKGGDEELKILAALEQEPKPNALKIGDIWWQRAGTHEGLARTRVRKHAAEWYQAALPQLEGLNRSKVAKRILEVTYATGTAAGAR